MSLADYYKEKTYLEAGEHLVTVDEYEIVFAKSGTKGVKLHLVDSQDKKIKETFYLTEKALPRLAGFARACGLTEQEMGAYDEDNDDSHEVLLGKRVNIWVTEGKPNDDGKTYNEVKSWNPATMEQIPAHPGPGEYAKEKTIEKAREKGANANPTEEGLPF